MHISWYVYLTCIYMLSYISEWYNVHYFLIKWIINFDVNLPEQMCVGFSIVLDWHGNETNNFAAIAIYCRNVDNSKHDKLLILVNMNFMTKIFGKVWVRIRFTLCSRQPLIMILRLYLCKSMANLLFTCNYSLWSQQTCRGFSAVSWTNLKGAWKWIKHVEHSYLVRQARAFTNSTGQYLRSIEQSACKHIAK